MKKMCFIILIFVSFFICPKVLAEEIYCEADYEFYTDSSGEQKCKKSLGAPMKEFNVQTCPKGTLIDGTCYDVKKPIKDGCEYGYSPYTDASGQQKCKKNLSDSEITKLIEENCNDNSSCSYIKDPVKGEMKCESGYSMFTDSSGNQKCKKSLGAPMTEYNKKTCPKGRLMDGTCYDVKDPMEGSNGCESGYSLYTNSSGQQKCKKNLNETEVDELMIKACETDPENCQYIKNKIEKPNSGANSGSYNEGTQVSGCEVIPEDIRKWIVNILKFVRYVALALVVALGSLDFMKAAGSGEADAMKKAGQTFIKRLIAVAILFLLPVIVDLILNMVNLYGVDPNNVDCL